MILVLFYLERKNYMIKLGARTLNLTDVVTDAGRGLCRLDCCLLHAHLTSVCLHIALAHMHAGDFPRLVLGPSDCISRADEMGAQQPWPQIPTEAQLSLSSADLFTTPSVLRNHC